MNHNSSNSEVGIPADLTILAYCIVAFLPALIVFIKFHGHNGTSSQQHQITKFPQQPVHRRNVKRKCKKKRKGGKNKSKGGGGGRRRNRLRPKLLLPLERDLSWYKRTQRAMNEEDKDDERNNGYILIDVNNVRGRVGFTKFSVKEFCAHLTYWAQEQSFEGSVLLEVDHGPHQMPQSFCDESSGVVMSFAGTKLKADDLIVMDLNFLARRSLKQKGESRHVVITSDRELKYRCKGVINTILRQERKKKLDHYFSGGNNAIEDFGHEPQLRFVDSDYFADYFGSLVDLNEMKEEYEDSWCSHSKFDCCDEDELVLTNQECTKMRKIQAKHLWDCLDRVGIPKSDAKLSDKSHDDGESEPTSSWMDDYMAWVSSGRRGYLNFYI